MPKHRSSSFLCIRYKWLVILSIFVLGLGLRLYRLGDNLFWFDEVGVANAAGQPSLREALAVSQLYIMSMPLDYIVAWGVAHISQSEAVLRLPSVLWGSLTLLAAYFLYREITDHHTAVLGMFLLALTPVHIRYSQELKFYAALTFFYVLASYLALVSVKKREERLWMIFLLVMMMGILFHVYTTLVLVNLTLWVVLSTWRVRFDYRLWNPFVLVTCIILLFAVIAIVFFGKSPGYPSALFGFESPVQVFGGGLGWLPLFPSSELGFLFGGLCMLFALIGSIITMSSSSNCFRLALFPAILLQVFLIVAGDIFKQYFALSRQFLLLVPFMVLLTAIGAEKTVRYLSGNVQKLQPPSNINFCVTIIIFLATAIPVLSQYYQAKRTDTLAVVNWLLANWQNGATVCIDPGYESFTYHYYLRQWASEKHNDQFIRIAESLFPFDLEACGKNAHYANYLITNDMNEQEAALLESEGFRPIYVSPANVIQPQVIWNRIETTN